MGRRNTAKTGDKAVYNSRPLRSKNEPRLESSDFLHVTNASDDDDLVHGDGSTSSNIPGLENVMDLGIEEESDSSDESNEEDEPQDVLVGGVDEESEDASMDSSSEDGNVSLDQNIDSSRWGKKKALYYHGDTADIEIGQGTEDAFDEEEAAKEIESSRFQVMEDDDFMIEDYNKNGGGPINTTPVDWDSKLTAHRDVSNLSKKEKRRFIKSQHPELLPLVTYFSNVCKDCNETTKAANALLNDVGVIQSVGATKEGQKYLLTKSILGNSAALNVAIYLLLKRDIGMDIGDRKSMSSVQSHPVMEQLEKCMSVTDALHNDVSTLGVENQVSYLVQAVEVTKRETSIRGSGVATKDFEDIDLSDKSVAADSANICVLESRDFLPHHSEADIASGKSVDKEYDLMNEARFGLRVSEAEIRYKSVKRRKESVINYCGDLNTGGVKPKKHLLASMINTLEQKSRKQRKSDLVEQIDEAEEDSALAQGLNMIEDELRTSLDSKEEEVPRGVEVFPVSQKHDPRTYDFYSAVAARSHERKATKQKWYNVAPKFPGSVTEVSGERAISRAMMRNRGLVAHKAKINRNPRVKKREQYRKALIRRKGTVREIRISEGHKYAGEGTGIKSGISRSRKL